MSRTQTTDTHSEPRRSPSRRRRQFAAYIPCACRDCFETAIGKPGAFCHDCEKSGCSGNGECSSPTAYGGEEVL